MSVALIAAATNWRRDRRLRGMTIWVGSMLIPLSLWGNKQLHYLMPVMPAVMVLVGWLLDAALKADFPIARLTTAIWALTVVGVGLAAPGVVIAAGRIRGHLIPADFVLGVFVLAVVSAVTLIWRRRGREPAMTVFAAGAALFMFAARGLWAWSLEPVNCRTVASAIAARYADGPYCFVGKEDLPLVFYMRRIIPVARSPGEIAHLAGRQPPVVAIEPISGTNRARPVIQEEARYVTETAIYRIGFVKADPAAVPASAPSADTDADVE
jgi:hypothetical protein